MNRVSRILVSVDLHAGTTTVVDKAARLAAAFDATLEIFAPVYNSLVSRARFPELGALDHARTQLVRSGLERLKEIEAGLGGKVEVECQAAWDHPPEEALIRRAMSTRADLVVAALDVHPEYRLPLFSGGDWQLVRHCPAPLLMCLPGEWKARPVIVAAVDPMHRHGRQGGLESRILRAADAVGKGCGGQLRAFHAYEAIVHGPGPGVHIELPVDQAEAALETGHRQALEQVFEASGVHPAFVDIQEGSPRDRLPAYCGEVHADVVVMGAIARNPLGRIFIGSTAERVLHRLPCDLMVIKPEGFRTPVQSEPYAEAMDRGGVLGVPGI
jgi:universal stress protein E